MAEYFTQLYSNSELQIWTAFVLGILVAIGPCQLTANIAAISFIGKDPDNKYKVFYNGLLYTLGRSITYFGLALLIFFGANRFKIAVILQKYGEKILGPLMIVIGILMLNFIGNGILPFNRFTQRIQQKNSLSYWESTLLGIVFALGFCPYNGALYFGILIPMSIQNTGNLYLPFIFAIATGLPVIIFAWLLAFTISGIAKLYRNIKPVEYWFRRLLSIIFILAGIYLTIDVWF